MAQVLKLSDAVFNALCRGRMQIPRHYLEWVFDLIGRNREKKIPIANSAAILAIHQNTSRRGPVALFYYQNRFQGPRL